MLSGAPSCGGLCQQGRLECRTPYTCGVWQPVKATLPDQLLATGAMSGPHRRAHPITTSPWARLRRAVRAFLINRKGPKL